MSPEQSQGSWLKVFCPQGRCLTEEEVADLPVEARSAAGDDGGPGLWLEVFCPDGACLTEEEQARAPRVKDKAAVGQGLWLELFCPGGACLTDEPSDQA